MAEELNKVTVEQIEETVKRIEELNSARNELKELNDELALRKKDLAEAETVYGVGSNQHNIQKDHVSLTVSKIEDVEKRIAGLSFKQSELRPILDEATKRFEEAYKADSSKEYHIELTPADENGVRTGGKKVFKQLLEYLLHNVSFTPKTAVSLMVLVRNMEENKPWVNSKDFDGVVILRSASILSLYRFIMEEMTGTGFYQARTFLDCWANCGESISNAVREIQTNNAATRKIGAYLTTIEGEFGVSENDIPNTENVLTTQEEVAPEVLD